LRTSAGKPEPTGGRVNRRIGRMAQSHPPIG
jgi:hypothetical protein